MITHIPCFVNRHCTNVNTCKRICQLNHAIWPTTPHIRYTQSLQTRYGTLYLQTRLARLAGLGVCRYVWLRVLCARVYAFTCGYTWLYADNVRGYFTIHQTLLPPSTLHFTLLYVDIRRCVYVRVCVYVRACVRACVCA